MKVFVAGASGVIGRPLVRRLVASGHDVTGSTRSAGNAQTIESMGARAVICDALDPATVDAAVAECAPEVVINELTSLPAEYKPAKASFYEQTNRLRSEGGHNLIEAAIRTGVRRFITQGIAFVYARSGSWVKDEAAKADHEAGGAGGEALRTMLRHEQEVLEAPGLEGLCLRYGFFYGPGTHYAREGGIANEIRRRRFPVVGSGSGTFSFIHTDDAASATACAIDHGGPGIYNVTDDEPATLSEWLPVYAEAIGAKPPRHVPFWLARLIAGKEVASGAIEMRGASNAKAKAELGWQPAHPSWRQGFFEALD